MVMGIELRPYQKNLVHKLVQDLTGTNVLGINEVLLAACPNAGKTEMALEVIDSLIRLEVVQRVLVLAHSTTILAENFLSRLAKQKPHLLDKVDVSIHQREHQIEGQYQLVIVDEAHVNYENGIVQKKIIQKVGAERVLLLTGSPSIFIARGLKPHVFALEDLYREGKGQWNADLMIELAGSAYALDNEDWNATGELKESASLLQYETDRTLDGLLGQLIKRIQFGPKEWNTYNKALYQTVAKNWNYVLGSLKKTVIACASIKMAEQVSEYFKQKKIKHLVSHSENDVNSSLIIQFKTNETPLLIVCDRAQLGFDMPELMHFVDMTKSRNPNRINQMMCRVVRTPKDRPPLKKLFVKVMPTSLYSSLDLRWFMSGVLSLAFHDFFSTWDGKNFMSVRVPMKREMKLGSGKKKDPSKMAKEPMLDSGMFLFGDYFDGLAHTGDKDFEPIAWTNLGRVLDFSFHNPEANKRNIIDFFNIYHRWPTQNKESDRTESRLSILLYQCYTNPNARAFDQQFLDLVTSMGLIRNHKKNTKDVKNDILDFYQKNGRWPRPTNSVEERNLAAALRRYTNETSSRYDKEFHEQVVSMGFKKQPKAADFKKEILDFYQKNGRWPNQKNGPEEMRLQRRLQTYKTPTNPDYDPEFHKQVEDFGYKKKRRSPEIKKEILDFYHINGRWPRGKNGPEEARLYKALWEFTKANNKRYDPEFHKLVENIIQK